MFEPEYQHSSVWIAADHRRHLPAGILLPSALGGCLPARGTEPRCARSAPGDTAPTHNNLIDCSLLCHPDQATMTEKTQEPHVEDDDDELDGKLNYKPPPQKTLQELQELDKDDESLAKYKKSLLGDGPVVVGRLGHTDREGLGTCTAAVCWGDEARRSLKEEGSCLVRDMHCLCWRTGD